MSYHLMSTILKSIFATQLHHYHSPLHYQFICTNKYPPTFFSTPHDGTYLSAYLITIDPLSPLFLYTKLTSNILMSLCVICPIYFTTNINFRTLC